MPFELRVVSGEPFARVRAWGDDDYGSATAGIQAVAADPRLTPGLPVLLDAREYDYLATPPEVSALATPGPSPGLFLGRRVAIVTRRGAQFGIARTFAARAEMFGAVTEVFVEPALAEAWLTGTR